MADFVKTMKDWKRMCRYYDAKYSMQACDRCPLEACLAIYDEGGDEDYAEKARKIEEWAAEHPEPVYPTWYEWLANMCIVPIELPPDQAIMVTDIGLLKPIPSDIAQKLGIEPKEDV